MSIFQWPEGVPSDNGCFNPNSSCLFGQLLFIFSDHKGEYFHRPEDVSSVKGCFCPNSVCLGSLFYSIGS